MMNTKLKIVIISGGGEKDGWDGPGTDAKFDGFGNVLVKLDRKLTDVCFISTDHKSNATQ